MKRFLLFYLVFAAGVSVWAAARFLGRTTIPVSPPVANFTYTPTGGVYNLSVAFTDTSTGTPTSWGWDFGDSSTTNVQSPTHVYTTNGTFSAVLNATNAGGYSSKTNTVTVTISPTNISNLAMWYKADSLSLANGNAITNWPDNSGNSRDLKQSTSGSAPYWTNNSSYMKGNPWAMFTYSPARYMTAAGMHLAQPNTFCYVYFWGSNPDTYQQILQDSTNLTYREVITVLSNTAVNHGEILANTYGITEGTVIKGLWLYDTVTVNGTSSTWYTNGILHSITNSGIGTTALGGYTLGARATTFTFPFYGGVAEVCIYNKSISGTERTNIESYFRFKYGL